ncbi:uncharacterized protein isoform X1 [Macaca fascicularis]|uniref:uncharacterized protein isoform X1 n=1 Tax=Macaca fascicularis TaxID=9541 RepID=UPI0032B04B50
MQDAIYRSRSAWNTLSPNASRKWGQLRVRRVKPSCSSVIHEVEVAVAPTPLLWSLPSQSWEPAKVLTAAHWPPEDTQRTYKWHRPAQWTDAPGCILSVLFSKRPRHSLKHPRIRSQPSGTTRSREYPGPAGPKSSLPHPVRCRGPGTPGAAPPCPPEPRVQAAGASSPCPTTSCRRSHRHRAWTTQSSRRRPRTLCPLPPQSSRGLLCPTPPTGTRHQCSQAANE